MKDEITLSGIVAGAISWLAMTVYLATKCSFIGNVTAIDMALFAVCSLGLLVPSWIVAHLFSDILPIIFKSKRRE